jgi:hypothetical protein
MSGKISRHAEYRPAVKAKPMLCGQPAMKLGHTIHDENSRFSTIRLLFSEQA